LSLFSNPLHFLNFYDTGYNLIHLSHIQNAVGEKEKCDPQQRVKAKVWAFLQNRFSHPFALLLQLLLFLQQFSKPFGVALGVYLNLVTSSFKLEIVATVSFHTVLVLMHVSIVAFLSKYIIVTCVCMQCEMLIIHAKLYEAITNRRDLILALGFNCPPSPNPEFG
jgi:hypothetical protein